MSLLAIVPAVVLGLALGSFANVAVHRWPRGGSVRVPARSHCPSCDHELGARDNVPVASWLALRGRCRHCEAPIAARYPLLEAGTAVLFGLVAWRHAETPWLLPALLVLTWALVVAAAIDLEHGIIPNRLTYRLPLVLAPLLVVAAWRQDAWADLGRAAVFGLLLPAAMLAVSEVFRMVRGMAGIGMGDVKLAVSLGLVLGFLGGAEVVGFTYLSIIAAVAVALVLMATGHARLATRLPFGPYLALGALGAVLGADDLAELVRGIFGL